MIDKLKAATSPVKLDDVTTNYKVEKYGDWFNTRMGGRDQLGQLQSSGHIATWPANEAPHAHHIVMKTGAGAALPFVHDSQIILQGVGIDPIFGYDNLDWAPNWLDHRRGENPSVRPGGTGMGYAAAVYSRLRETVATFGNSKAKVIETLQKISRDYIQGVW